MFGILHSRPLDRANGSHGYWEHVSTVVRWVSTSHYGRALTLVAQHCWAFCKCLLDKSKKNISPPRKSKKTKFPLTIDLLSLAINAPAPHVLTFRPHILREVRIKTLFRVPGPERRVKPTRKYSWVPQNVRSGALGIGNPNMKLVLV